ncbi:hypothetical protein V1517DRAFT_317925 [Lipomyces orientalis]|uniref:Uncharacterized protein n=1 Tax=Lipomyces orientalis TaxID=1233043 RepID=A0ACC3TTC9_9ASCO
MWHGLASEQATRFHHLLDAGAYDCRQLLTPWGLKYCSNCKRLWCRDKNATHNFLSRMVFLLAQPKESRQDGPGYLCRQVRQEQDDALHPSRNELQNANEMKYWTTIACERAHE